MLIVNEDELAKVAGRHGAVAEVLAGIDVPCAVVTLGARGCCATERGTFYLQPAFKVEPVDTTAAGDTFCGALAAARARVPPTARIASRERRRSSRDDASRRAVEHPSLGRSGRVAAIPADGRPGAADELARYCGVR